MNTERKERVFRGTLGALLGAILSGAFIVLEGRTGGAFSLNAGVAVSACTLQGYRQLAGRRRTRRYPARSKIRRKSRSFKGFFTHSERPG